MYIAKKNTGRHRQWSIDSETYPLVPVTGRPSLPIYIKQLWQRRYFVAAEARAKAFSADRNLFLGNLWQVLAPVIDITMYGVFFGLILKTSRGVDHFPVFLVIGVVLFRIISRDLTSGIALIRTRRNIIKAFAFPRAALVFSQGLRTAYDSLPSLLVLFVFIIIYPGTPNLALSWLFFPILYLFLKLFGIGLLFFSAWSTHLLPDLSRVIQVFVRFWFYGSGVFFSVEKFVDQPSLLHVMQMNPAYQFLNSARSILIYDSVPPFESWLSLAVWSLSSFTFGFIVFWTSETRYAKF